MKFILSFLATGALLSASTSYNLNVGKAATNFNELCNPASIPSTDATPVKCPLPVIKVVTTATPKCDVPVVAKCGSPVVECPKSGLPTPVPNETPSTATPEPASFALMGFGFLAAGAVRKFRKS